MCDIEIKEYGEDWVRNAICLARMYGVSECLSPLPYLPLDEVAAIVTNWTNEFTKAGQYTEKETDIVNFFEQKISKIQQGKNR